MGLRAGLDPGGSAGDPSLAAAPLVCSSQEPNPRCRVQFGPLSQNVLLGPIFTPVGASQGHVLHSGTPSLAHSKRAQTLGPSLTFGLDVSGVQATCLSSAAAPFSRSRGRSRQPSGRGGDRLPDPGLTPPPPPPAATRRSSTPRRSTSVTTSSTRPCPRSRPTARPSWRRPTARGVTTGAS